jgi:hypothetical protein
MDRRLGGPQSWSGLKRLEERSFAFAEDRTLVVQSIARQSLKLQNEKKKLNINDFIPHPNTGIYENGSFMGCSVV